MIKNDWCWENEGWEIILSALEDLVQKQSPKMKIEM